MTEADTCRELVTPKLVAAGWGTSESVIGDLPHFLWFYFTTDEGFAKVYAASPGTAARNRTMTAPALMAIDVPVPPVAAQQTFGRLQADVGALKAKHAAFREANAALPPATLERIFHTEAIA